MSLMMLLLPSTIAFTHKLAKPWTDACLDLDGWTKTLGACSGDASCSAYLKCLANCHHHDARRLASLDAPDDTCLLSCLYDSEPSSALRGFSRVGMHS